MIFETISITNWIILQMIQVTFDRSNHDQSIEERISIINLPFLESPVIPAAILILETSRVPAYNCYVSNQHRYNPGYTDSRNVWFWLAPQTCPAFLARSAAAALITTRTHPQPFRWSPAKPILPLFIRETRALVSWKSLTR